MYRLCNDLLLLLELTYLKYNVTFNKNIEPLNPKAMQKTTTSLFLVRKGGIILLAPTKATHGEIGQIDPPSCSQCFSFEGERINYIVSSLLIGKFCSKNFNNSFLLVNKPIKFSHKDKLGEKLFTAYIAFVKDEKTILREGFIYDPSELWVDLNEIKENPALVISPMFKEAIGLLNGQLRTT